MMNKFRKNAKGLSPIFATLILIAIAVIAGIVVYMFTSGTIATMTGGGTTGQEKVAIQAVEGSVLNGVTVYAQSTGGGTVTIESVILKTADGQIVDTAEGLAEDITTDLTTIIFAVNPTAEGDAYTITLISGAGNPFPSPSFIAEA